MLRQLCHKGGFGCLAAMEKAEGSGAAARVAGFEVQEKPGKGSWRWRCSGPEQSRGGDSAETGAEMRPVKQAKSASARQRFGDRGGDDGRNVESGKAGGHGRNSRGTTRRRATRNSSRSLPPPHPLRHGCDGQ